MPRSTGACRGNAGVGGRLLLEGRANVLLRGKCRYKARLLNSLTPRRGIKTRTLLHPTGSPPAPTVLPRGRESRAQEKREYGFCILGGWFEKPRPCINANGEIVPPFSPSSPPAFNLRWRFYEIRREFLPIHRRFTFLSFEVIFGGFILFEYLDFSVEWKENI